MPDDIDNDVLEPEEAAACSGGLPKDIEFVDADQQIGIAMGLGSNGLYIWGE